MPECPIPLLGRDLLSKLGAQIIKGEKCNYWYQRLKPSSQRLLSCRENQNQIILKEYWSRKCSNPPGLGQWNSRTFLRSSTCKHYPKTWIETCTTETIPFKIRGKKRNRGFDRKFKDIWVVNRMWVRAQHSCLLKKPGTDKYRWVQDLRSINQIVQDIHPVVANPYTLLTAPTENHQWFIVRGLKDTFFCIPLNQQSQTIFTFDWENFQTGHKTQRTWTVLLEGFKNSPAIFGNQLAKELELQKKDNPEGLVLQYVDDVLLAVETNEKCVELTLTF